MFYHSCHRHKSISTKACPAVLKMYTKWYEEARSKADVCCIIQNNHSAQWPSVPSSILCLGYDPLMETWVSAWFSGFLPPPRNVPAGGLDKICRLAIGVTVYVMPYNGIVSLSRMYSRLTPSVPGIGSGFSDTETLTRSKWLLKVRERLAIAII